MLFHYGIVCQLAWNPRTEEKVFLGVWVQAICQSIANSSLYMWDQRIIAKPYQHSFFPFLWALFFFLTSPIACVFLVYCNNYSLFVSCHRERPPYSSQNVSATIVSMLLLLVNHVFKIYIFNFASQLGLPNF